MRANGIDEKLITGKASDYDKFMAWAKTVPMTIGNPLYHWTHIELQRFFGIHEVLNEESAPDIWEKVNGLLSGEGYRARDFIEKSRVKVVCTTDGPVDSLEYHQRIKEDESFGVKVLPSFRPDKGLDINQEGYSDWVEKLQDVSGICINSYEDFLEALRSRVRFFHSVGGRISDHSLGTMKYAEASMEEVSDFSVSSLEC